MKDQQLSMANELTKKLELSFPMIMAPMFLVTNKAMLKAAAAAGIIGCYPALNSKTVKELTDLFDQLKKEQIPFGVNLIVSSSNPYLKDQWQATLNSSASFVITSLGDPGEIIASCHQKGKLVFCDVTNVDHAAKVQKSGADAIIAVSSAAGGHLGKLPPSILIPMLKKKISIPIIAAGGVADGSGVASMLALGAVGVSVGSIFLATEEATISDDYKNACVEYGAEDIVISTKISGTPCTVINTPYVQKIGTEQNWFEKLLTKHPKLKKWARAFTYYKGMKLLNQAAFSATYKTVWCAGPSIEFTDKIKPVAQIVQDIKKETKTSLESLSTLTRSL